MVRIKEPSGLYTDHLAEFRRMQISIAIPKSSHYAVAVVLPVTIRQNVPIGSKVLVEESTRVALQLDENA